MTYFTLNIFCTLNFFNIRRTINSNVFYNASFFHSGAENNSVFVKHIICQYRKNTA